MYSKGITNIKWHQSLNVLFSENALFLSPLLIKLVPSDAFLGPLYLMYPTSPLLYTPPQPPVLYAFFFTVHTTTATCTLRILPTPHPMCQSM